MALGGEGNAACSPGLVRAVDGARLVATAHAALTAKQETLRLEILEERARRTDGDERSGDGEGLTKNAARGARKPKTAFHGLMAGTPGRGVALEQTPIRRGGFDDTSSDEEAKME